MTTDGTSKGHDKESMGQSSKGLQQRPDPHPWVEAVRGIRHRQGTVGRNRHPLCKAMAETLHLRPIQFPTPLLGSESHCLHSRQRRCKCLGATTAPGDQSGGSNPGSQQRAAPGRSRSPRLAGRLRFEIPAQTRAGISSAPGLRKTPPAAQHP